ncbi:hypothetical protein JCM10212_002551 [Sporobolomyces blumeae]
MAPPPPLLPRPAAPMTDFYGWPKGDATCTVTAFSPASLSLHEYQVVHPAGDKSNRHPIIVSLIKHVPTSTYVLFDLGMSTDWKNWVTPGPGVEHQDEFYKPKVERNVDQVLESLGVRTEDVSYIVLSHHHFDHCAHSFSAFPNAKILGGPSTLSNVAAFHAPHEPPPSTSLVDLSWQGDPRATKVLTFEHSHDVFDDGSLLIVPTPGHTPGHVAAVVRTGCSSTGSRSSSDAQGDEYVVLSGDCAHHPSCLSPPSTEFRMGAWRLPDDDDDGEAGVTPRHSMHEDYSLAETTLERLKALERRAECLVVLAHDFRRWDAWKSKRGSQGQVGLDGWRKKGLKV